MGGKDPLPPACTFPEARGAQCPRCHRAGGRGSDRPPFSLQTQHYFLLCFLLKFSLTISSCLVCFGFTLQSVCDSSRARNLTNCSSIMLRRWVLTLSAPPTFPGRSKG